MPASIKVYPGKLIEGRRRAEKMAAKSGKPVSLLQPFYKQVRGGKTKMVWTTYDTVYPAKSNPRSSRSGGAIPAKLIPKKGGGFRVMVAAKYAKRMNPGKHEYLVMLFNKDAARNVPITVMASTAGQASRLARKRKGEVVDTPRKWRVLSVKRVGG